MITIHYMSPTHYRSGGFRAGEINELQKKIQDNQEQIIEAWNEYFND